MGFILFRPSGLREVDVGGDVRARNCAREGGSAVLPETTYARIYALNAHEQPRHTWEGNLISTRIGALAQQGAMAACPCRGWAAEARACATALSSDQEEDCRTAAPPPPTLPPSRIRVSCSSFAPAAGSLSPSPAPRQAAARLIKRPPVRA